MSQPTLLVLAGPNGAGKTTSSQFLLRDALKIDEFVNADQIASGLSTFSPATEAFAAGRVMIERLRGLAGERRTFAFETTLATRSFAPWIRSLRASGYKSSLVFLALPNADLAVQRVRKRVSEGGHNVPEDIIRRRFLRGLSNLTHMYQPVVDEWAVYDSSGPVPRLVAESGVPEVIHDQPFYQQLLQLVQAG